MSRVCIIAKDIQMITGKSPRHCRNVLAQIKLSRNKERHQEVTVTELCQYLGVEMDEIRHYFK
jgi:hypothetical protein